MTLGADTDASIQHGTTIGLSAAEVARRAGISESTARRRMAESRGSPAPRGGGFAAGRAREGGPPADAPTPPASGGDMPTEEDIEEAARGGASTLDSMLTSCVAAFRATEPGPIKQRWGALILRGLDDRRKATPPERPDPNEAPDMMAAARRARAMLHHLIDTSPEEH